MQKYIIGIDTGGTYTDAALIDQTSGQVMATAKEPTTHHQLALGTGNALKKIIEDTGIKSENIELIAVSSTLATNSIIENKGARVAVIVIGYVKHFKLPVKAVTYVKGGHNIQGKEEEPLDIEYLVTLIEKLKNEVDAYGVCSAMSIKNPAHELVTEKAISLIDPLKPVFCSHRISQLTGMQERAATAGLHAKLMPIMQKFVDGVTEAMSDQSITCPMIIIGGNGKALAAEKVVEEAGLTVASGPACTAFFGATHTRSDEDSLVIDVGGTTTDIAMIEQGHPLLAGEGCQIGQWKTHIEAVNMRTEGIGGDSHVHLDDQGNLTIGPGRVTPLSMAENPGSPADWLGAENCSRLIILRPGTHEDLPDNELCRLLKKTKYITPAAIRAETGLGGIALDVQLEHLTRNQHIFECGFTPTDALHSLGLITIGKTSTASSGAEILGKTMGMTGAEFSKKVIIHTEELIENLIIDYIVQRYWQKSLTNFISTRKNHPILGVDFSLKVPLIGLGAAGRYFLPRVAEKLGTTVQFPQNCEVGNAVGAAIIGQSSIRSS